MASASIDELLLSVMALRSSYVAAQVALVEKWREGGSVIADFDIEADPAITRVMQAIADFHEHMRTR